MKAVPATIIGFATYDGTKRGLKAWRKNYEKGSNDLVDSAKNEIKQKFEKNSKYHKLAEKHPEPLLEKKAALPALASMAKFVPQAVGRLGSFATSAVKSTGNFAKGFTGLGKLNNFKKPAYSAGMASAITAPRNFTKGKSLSQYGKYSPTAKVKGINTSRTNTVG